MRLRVATSHVVSDRLGVRLRLQKLRFPVHAGYGRLALTQIGPKVVVLSAMCGDYTVAVTWDRPCI